MKTTTAKSLLKKVVKDYNQISKHFNTTRQYKWTEFEAILPFLEKNKKIIDLGCGNGRFYQFLKDSKLNTKLDYTGIDNSSELLTYAKKQHPEAKFTKGDILEIPAKNKSIDTIISIAAIHHIPSKKLREKAFQEIARTLKTKGKLIFTVWNLFQPKYKKYIWKARFKSLSTLGKYDPRDTLIPWAKTGIERYYYAFTIKEIYKLLKKNNFKIIKEEHGKNFLFICEKMK